jgi:nitrogen fixation protein FixH
MTDITPQTGFRINGWHVLIAVTLFFALIIGVDAFFMVKAYSTFSGEVASNPYEAGLAFNQRLAERRSQDALGWSVGLNRRPTGEIEVSAVDARGAALTGLHAELTIERPATETGRKVAILQPLGPGLYGATLPLASGAWDLRVTLNGKSGGPFRAERRIMVP